MPREVYFSSKEVVREIMSNSHDDQVVVRTAQDVEPVIKEAEALRDLHKTVGHRRSRAMVPVAEIPMIVYEQAAREGWLHDPKKWRAWANDPQNACFRITTGKI